MARVKHVVDDSQFAAVRAGYPLNKREICLGIVGVIDLAYR